MRYLLLMAVLFVVVAGPTLAEPPSPSGRQELFDLSVRRAKLQFELATLDKRLVAMERTVFAEFERVADPTGTDYWESVSDTVLFANAQQAISKGELLLYHAPGIYRVKDVRPSLATEGECWYFRPNRDIKQGERITIVLVYDAPEDVAAKAKGLSPSTHRGRDPKRAFNTQIVRGD
ncbi:hypothetical protein NA78x_000467 [Anatilimnocola sp. NA78]|uniref:hypothetical protein n=1 Tax=Anatilimnocola sp. NA78 TaxID=3415683 RepID=UPI003CE5AA7C